LTEIFCDEFWACCWVWMLKVGKYYGSLEFGLFNVRKIWM
jgi:hypothetical protein